MKIIRNNKIASISASEADSDYPVANVQTDFRTQLWKATTASSAITWDTGVEWGSGTSWASSGTLSKITLTMNYPSEAVGIANTNAEYVQVRVIGHDGSTEVQFGKYNISEYSSDIFIEYPEQDNTHSIEIEFAAADGVIPECGIIRAGQIYEFRNPNYGLQEKLVDHSITRALNNGAIYYKQRSITRVFSGSIQMPREESFYKFLYKLAQENGANPLMWQVTDVNSNEWAIFARFSRMPSGVHDYYNYSQIQFELEEGL